MVLKKTNILEKSAGRRSPSPSEWKIEVAKADFAKFAYSDGNKVLLDALAKR